MNQPTWVGQVLGGRYHLEALLGQGGMSSVYRGSDSNLRRAVAVKLIHTHLTNDPEFIRRFETEAAAVAKLRHPNIIQVFDFDRDNGTYYMVLELVSGESGDKRVRRLAAEGERMPPAEVAAVVATIAEAIDYAHQQGLIHRDLKPANIMLTENGQAVLMDFGVAKILGGTQHTATGMVIGTAYYIAPEMVRGRPPSAQSDIYALGATLFEMLAGQPPFTGDSAMSVMMKHVSEPVPDVRQLAPDTPAYLAAVVEKAMAKDPTKRFQTAGAMAAALRKGIANPNALPEVAPTGEPESPARPVRSGQVSDSAAIHPDDVPTKPPSGMERPGRAADPASRPGFPFPLWMVLAVVGVALTCLVLGAAGSLLVLLRLRQVAQVSPTAAATAEVTLTARAATPTVEAPTELAASEAAPPTDTAAPAPSATAEATAGIPTGMLLIQAGSFQMGSNKGAGDERPTHAVSLDAFYMDETEVTNSAYGACVKDGACPAPINAGSFTRPTYFDDPAFANYPVTSVRWDQAAAFCQWNEGKRLPTEAEWEYAATGGDGRTFPWGDTFDLQRLPAGEPDTVAVGSYRNGASPFGMLDMAGNAVEWVSDFYDATYYARAEPNNPPGPAEGNEHVTRGGAFGNPDASFYTTTRRYHLALNATDVDVGFRCAKTP